MDDTEKNYLRHLVAHKDAASLAAYAQWLKGAGRHGDAERLQAAADGVGTLARGEPEVLAADPEHAKLTGDTTEAYRAKLRTRLEQEEARAPREFQQAAIALRAEELLAADPEYADLDPGSREANERRHAAQQRADNELHGAGWEVAE